MTSQAHCIPRSHFQLAALLLLAGPLPLLSANEKTHAFDFPANKVWVAASEVCRAEFNLESLAEEAGTLTFRAGPTPAVSFRFDVSVKAESPNRTLVTLRIRTRNVDLPALQKAAWRSGDKFFASLATRLTKPSGGHP
jgi:hypothetical protein